MNLMMILTCDKILNKCYFSLTLQWKNEIFPFFEHDGKIKIQYPFNLNRLERTKIIHIK